MAYRFAQRLGFPVIVKPNSKSQGCGVTKVFTKREFDEAVRFICERENVFLVQRVAQGNDYRGWLSSMERSFLPTSASRL